MKHKIIIINGPNLNLLGEREQSQYGSATFKELKENCLLKSNEIGIELDFVQSNIEGELVNLIQDSRKKYDGLIINAAGYTHTSVAIRDALMIITIPIVELHITNIYNREKFRHKSLISKAAKSIICGFGVKGYTLALEGLKEIIKNENR